MTEAQPTLVGRFVRLEPLTIGHVAALSDVGLDPDLWRWIPVPIVTPVDMREYVETALQERDRGIAMPFVQVECATGKVIGSTRYANLERLHRRVEIGWTWIGHAWHRSAINTEAKYLLLAHAFDVMGMQRVELKTDALNARSRAAIQRIGATEEGTLRSHMVTASGRRRDTVYYSVLASEWPAVRDRLRLWMGRNNSE